jgi:hypothetical protein
MDMILKPLSDRGRKLAFAVYEAKGLLAVSYGQFEAIGV